MAINKVQFGDQILMDITDSTIIPSDVNFGKVFYNAAGTRSIGTGPNFIKRTDDIQIRPGPANEWTRPNDWPDLDSLNLELSGDDFIYMTFDCHDSSKRIIQKIYTTDKSNSHVALGYIENGEFIIVYEVDVANGGLIIIDPTYYNLNTYAVLRITGTIKQSYSIANTFNSGDTTYTQTALQLPLLERIAWIPNINTLCPSSSAWGAYTLEHDVVANGQNNALTSLSSAWNGCYRLQKLEINNLYTNDNTSLQSTFNSCISLTSLDLHHWSTSNVTSLGSTFSSCYSLKTLNCTGWTTNKCTNFSYCFSGCRSLENVDFIANFNTENVTTMLSMFSDCYSVLALPIENFNVSKVTTFSNMFNNCLHIQYLDFSKWQPINVTNFNSFLSNCWSLKTVNFSGWTTTGTITTMSNIFAGCRSLQELDISWLHVTSSCTSIYNAFGTMQSIKELHLPNDWDLSGITGGSNNTLSSIFAGCYCLETITGIENWQLTAATSIASIFSNDFSLKNINISNWNVTGATSVAGMFYYCYSLEELDLSKWQPSASTNFSQMFQCCYSLKTIGNIDHWNTSHSTTFASMFSDCWSLTELPDITQWDFSAATTLASMFTGCQSIIEMDYPNLDLPNVTTIATMFRYCRNLRKADISGWSIPKLNTAPGSIFGDCWTLKELKIFPIPLNFSISGCYVLNKLNILTILNALPTVTSAHTLNLMNQNINQLQAADKAIAINKGWTLAN